MLYCVKDEARLDKNRLSDQSERTFTVRARLSKHPEASETINSKVDPEDGGSYVLAPPGIECRIAASLGSFQILQNKRHELSVIVFECTATSTDGARQQFLSAVTPFLDYIAFTIDAPIHLPVVVCEDHKNQLAAFEFVAPSRGAMLTPHAGSVITDLNPLFALYREGKNASSPFYKFLCYFKILEGIYKHVRPETFKKAREKNIDIKTTREIVPSHPELDTADVGKPIGPLFENRFQKQFRDGIAHYLLDSGSVLNVSDHATSSAFWREVLLLETCVRVVIQSQMEYCNLIAAKAH